MKRLVFLAVLALGFVAGRPAPATADTTLVCSATMWAGQKTNVGTVSVLRDGTNILVRYQTAGPWTMSEIHVHLAATLSTVPQTSGGPVPGKFAWKAALTSASNHTVTIPVSMIPKGAYIVLAHAVVSSGGSSVDCSTQLTLPTNAVQVAYAFPGSTTYADIQISGAGALDGTYGGWCVDVDHGIGGQLPAFLVSTLAPAAAAVVDRPDNLDLVNFILNRDYSSIGAGVSEIQAAIWDLVDDKPWGGGINPNPAIVDQIVADAMTFGQGFVPGAGQVTGVLVVPVDPTPWTLADNYQIMVFGLRNPECPPGKSETAWAGNKAFPGSNWALYFTCPKPLR